MDRIQDYTYEEFLNVADMIASGSVPPMIGRRMSIKQWRICNKLAELQEISSMGVIRRNWTEFRKIVLLTRLAPEDRNKVYDGEIE